MIRWKCEDLIDAALNRLSDNIRWQIVDFLMTRGIIKYCRCAAYLWSYEREGSFFEIGDCNLCGKEDGTYCGKEKK
jgi:hypothetical protein